MTWAHAEGLGLLPTGRTFGLKTLCPNRVEDPGRRSFLAVPWATMSRPVGPMWIMSTQANHSYQLVGKAQRGSPHSETPAGTVRLERISRRVDVH